MQNDFIVFAYAYACAYVLMMCMKYRPEILVRPIIHLSNFTYNNITIRNLDAIYVYSNDVRAVQTQYAIHHKHIKCALSRLPTNL